jgi:3-deoxy-7-phosphoheptulonate synthase
MDQLLTTPQELKKKLPTSFDTALFLKKVSQEIATLFTFSQKKVLLVGPCSIHSFDGALLYAEKLAKLSHEVQDHFLIFMRVHIEKPRTRNNWRGFVYDPDLLNSFDIEKGLFLSRKLFLEILKLNLPITTEILDPFLYPYFSDVLSWGNIGARTVTSPNHRLLASDCQIPIGFKNPLDGDITSAIYGVEVATAAQTILALNENGTLIKKTSIGNPLAHLVHRGSSTKGNFEKSALFNSSHDLKAKNLFDKIVVDCGHGNSLMLNQAQVFENVIDEFILNSTPLLGIMLESYLQGGSYTGNNIARAPIDISITDPCLSFEETRELILKAQSKLISSNQSLCLNS